MRRAKYIIVEAALVFGLLAMACGASEPAKLAVQDGSSEAERFPIQAAETLQRIQTQHELLASADVDSMSPAEQDQRFRIVQNEIAYDMGTVQSMEVPENWIEYRQRLADLLIAEQHIWDHMTLYALSGEEGQRTEARLEAVDIELEAQRLASEVTGLLESQGNELAVLMPNFTLPPAPVVEATSGSETNAPNTVAPYGAPSELTPDASAITIPDLTLTGGVGTSSSCVTGIARNSLPWWLTGAWTCGLENWRWWITHSSVATTLRCPCSETG
ncbi:MAG: hypothetical protein O3A33_08310 [Chloroflexi bacterium]|nr:hypothetical protein [Chloroflexota bacterium]